MNQPKSIIFISYWGFNEGLTQATVLPHLQILARSPHVGQIILVTVERQSEMPLPQENVLGNKILVKPYKSNKKFNVLLTKMDDFIGLAVHLRQLVKIFSIDTIIARGAPAGNLAWRLHKKTGLPFYVESFEPHADYMLESAVWKKWDPRYWIQKWGEKQTKSWSSGLITVSDNYAKQLLKENIDISKVKVVPCTVDISRFQFCEMDGKEIRAKHNIPGDAIVGINVGKYGSIYHDKEAFRLFARAFDYFTNYWQFFITPDIYEVKNFIKVFNLPLERCIILTLDHNEVPSYLSAADFAYALIKATPAKKYCSPIKTGEYWANGLPVIITEGIGDDSNIIHNSGWGAVWDAQEDSSDFLFQQIDSILKNKSHRSNIQVLATKYRDRALIEKAYRSYSII